MEVDYHTKRTLAPTAVVGYVFGEVVMVEILRGCGDELLFSALEARNSTRNGKNKKL